MFRKSSLFIVLSLVLCFGLGLVAISAAPVEAKMTIKALSAWGKNHDGVKGEYLPFIARANKMVEAKYPGEFEIKYIGGSAAVPIKDQPEALRKGIIDMYYGTAAYYAGLAPAANCIKLSKLTSQGEKDSGADAILDKLHREKLNATYIGALGSQLPFQLYSKKKITSVADLKGMRIRTSAMYLDFLKALGAIPVSAKPGAIYQAMERGVVDGTMWPLYSVRGWGWHEVAKYVVGPGFYKVSHPLLVNLKTWNKIPKKIQDVIKEAMRLEVIEIDITTEKLMKAEYGLLEKAGMQIVKFSPADTKKYLDMAYDSGWAGQLKMEQEVTQKLRKLISK